MVGIFWFVLDRAGMRHLLAEGCAIAEAVTYGDCLTFEPGHYEIWERWRRAGPPDRALASIVRACEYEEWPRGRIVLDCAADRFVLYADRRITTARLTSEVAGRFRLPLGAMVARHDLHYRSTRSI